MRKDAYAMASVRHGYRQINESDEAVVGMAEELLAQAELYQVTGRTSVWEAAVLAAPHPTPELMDCLRAMLYPRPPTTSLRRPRRS